MDFQKCPTCEDCWQPIDHEQLHRELTTTEIDLMIERKATVRKGMSKYRRLPLTITTDWAKDPHPVYTPMKAGA